MPAGRVSISPRALQRTVAAIAAEELRVPVKDVGIQLSDARGLLAVSVVAPLRMSGLGASENSLGILTRCSEARSLIRSKTLALTGSEVRTVAVRVTRASIQAAGRVA